MTIVNIILGVLLTALFFLTVKNAADLLIRIIGGFLLLIIYNTVAPMVSLPILGINAVSAATAGLLGLPGVLLIICLGVFL